MIYIYNVFSHNVSLHVFNTEPDAKIVLIVSLQMKFPDALLTEVTHTTHTAECY